MDLKIFDKKNWEIDPLNNSEETLRNRALGSIGHKMAEMKNFAKKLEKTFNLILSEDYKFALDLQKLNPKAFNIMQITYKCSDAKVEEALNYLNNLFALWLNLESRNEHWRSMNDLFDSIRECLEPDSYFLTTKLARSKTNTLSVSGNEAWTEYLTKVKALDLCNQHKT